MAMVEQAEQLWFEDYTLEGGGATYVREQGEMYRSFADTMRPDLEKVEHIVDRVAFAILTANTRFEASVAGLHYWQAHRWRCRDFELVRFGGGLTGNKAGYLNCLPRSPARVRELLKKPDEDWHAYRLRLQKEVRGLGMAKASFAACLLYPSEAEICCIDTWMSQLLQGRRCLPTRWTHYIALEDKVRSLAKDLGFPVFLTQWALWDWARGRVESHNVF